MEGTAGTVGDQSECTASLIIRAVYSHEFQPRMIYVVECRGFIHGMERWYWILPSRLNARKMCLMSHLSISRSIGLLHSHQVAQHLPSLSEAAGIFAKLILLINGTASENSDL